MVYIICNYFFHFRFLNALRPSTLRVVILFKIVLPFFFYLPLNLLRYISLLLFSFLLVQIANTIFPVKIRGARVLTRKRSNVVSAILLAILSPSILTGQFFSFLLLLSLFYVCLFLLYHAF